MHVQLGLLGLADVQRWSVGGDVPSYCWPVTLIRSDRLSCERCWRTGMRVQLGLLGDVGFQRRGVDGDVQPYGAWVHGLTVQWWHVRPTRRGRRRACARAGTAGRCRSTPARAHGRGRALV